MTCPNGHATDGTAPYCPTCGAPVASATTAAPAAATVTPTPAAPESWPATGTSAPAAMVPYPTPAPVASIAYPVAPGVAEPRTLYLIAAIINWVVLGLIILFTFGFGIIAAAWFVPMTIQLHKGVKSPYKHTALGVCTLIFCNLISGILVLVDDSGKADKPRAA